MKYNKIENKYIKAGVKGHYKFENALEVQKVLGYDLKAIPEFKILSVADRTLAEKLICSFINGFGLEARERLRLVKIKRESGKFTVYYGNSYSYLYDSGSVG